MVESIHKSCSPQKKKKKWMMKDHPLFVFRPLVLHTGIFTLRLRPYGLWTLSGSATGLNRSSYGGQALDSPWLKHARKGEKKQRKGINQRMKRKAEKLTKAEY
ncbi:hypothetical protein AWENTII_011267 [Aspergillus wentii]